MVFPRSDAVGLHARETVVFARVPRGCCSRLCGIVFLQVVPLKPQDMSDQHFPVL